MNKLIIKTWNEIYNYPWDSGVPKQNRSIQPKWFDYHTCNPTYKDISLWEQLYFEPGNIGVYGAYSPDCELYIILQNLFIKDGLGIEEYFGNNAQKEVFERCKDLGILLPTDNAFVENGIVGVY